ncbi:nSTAND1 domain-containing NTPase [Nocardia sp. bgisy118]|uniref:nSTAND1 domain-containing NTPase n=1 Tax=Nocardia sp. bgisy118 TaxID=3413786 RepID=UPI003F49DCCB
MYRVFLSHSRRDNAAAQALLRWLTDNEPSLKGQIFLDIDPDTGFAPGVRWKSELTRAVDRCEAVLCLVSRHWENSHECLAEARLAESLNKRVFCARIDPAAQGERVREWQICDLFPDGDGEITTVLSDAGEPVHFATDGLARLLRGLHDAGIGAEYFPWPPDDDTQRAPYRGWQSMEDVDAAVFFGRDPQILRGLDTLRGMRAAGVEGLFVILGPSGVGKSSFLRAGLLPRLRRDPTNFLVCEIVRPERAALTGDQGLAEAIYRLRAQAGPGGPTLGDVKAACHDTDTARLATWLREAQLAAAGDAGVPTVVLPIDQGEELFSADAGPEAATFLALLGALLQTGALDDLPLIAAMSIRADRYESLQNAPELLAVHTREFGDLKPMPVTEYKDVITGPAARATAAGLRLSLDAALVARLLDDTTGGADSLPLLALMLSRLYLDYGSAGRLTLANYEAIGGMRRIVEAEIDTLLAANPDRRAQQLDTLRGAFIPWLATIDQDTDAPSRRVARWDELPPDSHELIDAMVTRRLLVKDERGGETVVEVALESLLRQWDSLASWLSEHAQDLKAADSLDRAAADWELNRRSQEWLFEGVRLATAEQLAGSTMFRDRVRHAADFLAASREHEDARADAERQRREAELRNAQQRREEAEAYAAALRHRARVLVAVLAGTLAVALVAVIALVVAVHASKEADAKRHEAEARSRDALSGRLTSQVQAMLSGGRPGTELEVVVKALAAHRLSEREGIGALLSVLDEKPRVDMVMDVAGAQVSADGRRIAARTASSIQLWDTETGEPIGDPFTDPQFFAIFAMSPDGRYLAMGSEDFAIRIWDSDSRQFVGQPMIGSEKYVDEAAVSADGRRVAAIDGNDNLRLWDVQTSQQIASPLRGHTGDVNALAFSRDGRRLASAGDDQTVRLWDADNAAPQGEPLRGEDVGLLSSVAFSPDGHIVAAGGYGALSYDKAPLLIWNADTGAPIGRPATGTFKAIWSVAFSSDGTRIATGGTEHSVRLWDARTGDSIGDPITLQMSVWDIAFTPGDDRIVSGSPDTVQVLRTAPGSGLSAEMAGSKAAEGHGTYWLVNTKGGPRLVVFNDNTMRWLDIDTGRQIGAAMVSEALRDVSKIDFSADDRWLAVLSRDNELRVLDASNGQPYGEVIKTYDEVDSVALSPDGQTLAIGSDDNTARLWDWRHSRPIGEPMGGHKYFVGRVAFSEDGRRLYSQSFDSVRIWDTATQQLLGEVRSPAAVTSMAISPDGRRLAIADYNYIQEFDARDAKPVGSQIPGRGLAPEALSYNSDGRYLVSIAPDKTVRFWDVASRTQIGDAVDATATGEGTEIEFSPDQRRVFVTANADYLPVPGGLSWVGGGVWELPAPAVWKEELCKKLVANPTQRQWEEWVSPNPDVAYTELCPGKPGG